MALFAAHRPDDHGTPPPAGLRTRTAAAPDLPGLVALRVERGDATAATGEAAFRRLIGRATEGHALVLAALLDESVVGCGTVERLDVPTLPAGWYLGGLLVTPALRRRGIGVRLTRERLDWIGARAAEAYYFVNARNLASIDLHAPLGFQQLAGEVEVPGVTFVGGVGLLFRADLGARRR